MESFRFLGIEDLENEEWIDVIGFDGIYQVSNLGRFKSLQREKITRWGTSTILPEKIMKQSVVKKGNRIDGLNICLSNNLIKKTFNSSRTIFNSFFPKIEFSNNECVMHINKNPLDNRLVNLQKVSRKKSKKTDMDRSIRTIIAVPKNLKKAQKAVEEFYENRTHKQCSICGKIDLVENFPNGISKCQPCMNERYKYKRKTDIKKGVEKKCNRCKLYKNDFEFPKYDGTCKTCRNDLHSEYYRKQKEEIGDWYVKNYGKTNYKIIDFTPKIIEDLRKEIMEKRKPRHIYDNLEFSTTIDFAKYIFKKYKIPISTVKKRISDGKTEYECTLNRSQFILYNKKKLNSELLKTKR